MSKFKPRFSKCGSHFMSWLADMDHVLNETVGMTRQCFGDFPYRARFDAELSPIEAAQELLRSEYGERCPIVDIN